MIIEDMLETITGNKNCKSCKRTTRHNLIELVEMDGDGSIIELIDAWFECIDCGQTTPIPDGTDEPPF